MSEPVSPDAPAAAEPPRPAPAADPNLAYRTSLIRMAVGVIGWLGVSFVVCRYLGIGGLRFGWLLCAAIIGGGAVAVILLVARRLPSLSSYVASVAVIGLALGANVAASAPLSAPRLGEYLDTVAIEGTVEKETTAGSVRCDPSCPSITREYRMLLGRTTAAQNLVEGRLLVMGADQNSIVRERDRFEATVPQGRIVGTFRKDGLQIIATIEMTATPR